MKITMQNFNESSDLVKSIGYAGETDTHDLIFVQHRNVQTQAQQLACAHAKRTNAILTRAGLTTTQYPGPEIRRQVARWRYALGAPGVATVLVVACYVVFRSKNSHSVKLRKLLHIFVCAHVVDQLDFMRCTCMLRTPKKFGRHDTHCVLDLSFLQLQPTK